MGPAELPNVTARRLPDSLRNKHTTVSPTSEGLRPSTPTLQPIMGPRPGAPRPDMNTQRRGESLRKKLVGGCIQGRGCSLGPHPGEARPQGLTPHVHRGAASWWEG